MAQTDLKVRLDADSSGLERGFKSAAASARVFERELAKMQREQQRMGNLQAAASREMQADFARRRDAEAKMSQLRTRATREMEAEFARRRDAVQREGNLHAKARSEMEADFARREQLERDQANLITNATREMEADFERRRQAQGEFLDGLGRGLLAFGAASTVGLGLASRAAMKWESAWAGVLKVIDGSPEQIAALEQGLRQLANRLPVAAEEIAGVAEAAGQLGVAVPDLLKFTETAIALGVSTNLSSEDAATGLAKLGNIMGVTTAQVDRAGATLVALGNAGASTESDILSMALRIAGAGTTARMSEADVLALANAMSSMGIEAEMGGSAISRVISNINAYVLTGNKRLRHFADLAGMTAKDFAAAWRADPSKALSEVIAGFGRMQKAGGDVYGVMEDLEIKDIRVKDVMLRLGAASDLLTDSLKLGNRAWDENSALIKEAARRYDTAESRIAMARNQLNNAAIDIGGTVLPVIADLAAKGGTLAEMWSELPGPVREAATVLGVAAAAIGLVGGTALVAVPRVIAFKAALDEVGSTGGRVGKAASGMGKALSGVGGFLAGPWGLAIGAAVTVAGVFAAKQVEAKQSVEELARTLDTATSAVTQNTSAMVVQRLEADGVLKAAEKMGLSLDLVTRAALGQADAMAQVDAATGKALATVAQRRSYDETAKAARKVAEAVRDQSGELDKAVAQHRREQAALGQTGKAATQAATNVDELTKSVDQMTNGTLDARSATRRLEQAIDAATERAKKHSHALNKQRTDFETTTQAGRDNQETLDEVASAVQQAANLTLKATGSQDKYAAALRRGRQRLAETAQQFGLTKKAAQELAEKLIQVPDQVKVQVETPGLAKALRDWDSLYGAVRKVQGLYVVGAYASGGAPRGKPLARAGGGYVPNAAGSGVVDDVPAILTAGEYVVNKRATAANRALLAEINAGNGRPVSRPVPMAVTGSASTRGGDTYVLDSAVAASTARGYAQEIQAARARAERLQMRRG